MRFLMFWFLILFLLTSMGIGRIFYHEDNTQDIYNITDKLVWNESLFESKIETTTNDMNVTQRAIVRITNIIYKGVSNIGFIAMEVAKFGVELGYTNPDYNYLWFSRVIFYLLILCILLVLIPSIPIIVALIYLLVKAISNLGKYIEEKSKRRKQNETTKSKKTCNK